jgi:hypothetical protein
MPCRVASFVKVITGREGISMMTRLALYGSREHAHTLAKVGLDKGKTPQILAARMPSREVAAKVGGAGIHGARTRRVVRLNERG